jgi:hypothetical protein
LIQGIVAVGGFFVCLKWLEFKGFWAYWAGMRMLLVNHGRTDFGIIAVRAAATVQ